MLLIICAIYVMGSKTDSSKRHTSRRRNTHLSIGGLQARSTSQDDYKTHYEERSINCL